MKRPSIILLWAGGLERWGSLGEDELVGIRIPETVEIVDVIVSVMDANRKGWEQEQKEWS